MSLKAEIERARSQIAANQISAAKDTLTRTKAAYPQSGAPDYWLGLLAEKMGDLHGAEASYRASADAEEPERQSFLQLAQLYQRQNRTYDTLALLAQGETAFSGDRDLTFLRGRFAANAAPLWHLPMLADTARNEAYQAAIDAQVRPGDIVLDIGTGSGLLAMMAARAGAAHVYACEGDPVLAALAREIVDRNGYGDKITVLDKHSTALKVGTDLPCKADCLVTEIFDNALVGEGVLPTLTHAWAELLADGARVVPSGATLHGVVTSAPHLVASHHTGDVCGFDLSAMNVLAHPLGYKDAEIHADAAGERRISAPFEVYCYDFTEPPPATFDTVIDLTATTTGQADSVRMWFDLDLAPGIRFSTETVSAVQHWRQVGQLLARPVDLAEGEQYRLTARYQRYFDFALARG